MSLAPLAHDETLVKWGGREERKEQRTLTRSPLVLGMRIGKGWGQGYPVQDDLMPSLSSLPAPVF